MEGNAVFKRIMGRAESRTPYTARIKLGEVVEYRTKDGKTGTRPNQLDHFVFDLESQWAKDNTIREQLVNLYGTDKPKQLRVRLISQYIERWYDPEFKMYSKGKWVKCRGDGETARSVELPTEAQLKANKYARATYNEIPCGGENCTFYETKQCQLKATVMFSLADMFPPVTWAIETASLTTINAIPRDFVDIRKRILEIYPDANLCRVPLVLYRRAETIYSPTHPAKTAFVVHLDIDWDTVRKAMPLLYGASSGAIGSQVDMGMPQIGMDEPDDVPEDDDVQDAVEVTDTTEVEITTTIENAPRGPQDGQAVYDAIMAEDKPDAAPAAPPTLVKQNDPVYYDVVKASQGESPWRTRDDNPASMPIPPAPKKDRMEEVPVIASGKATEEQLQRFHEEHDKIIGANWDKISLRAKALMGDEMVKKMSDLSAEAIASLTMDCIEAQTGTGKFAPKEGK